MWYAMLRFGAVRGLDIGDIDLEEAYINPEHRPQTETTLKNCADSEQSDSISETTAAIPADYIGENRHQATNDYGRQPLFINKYGRPSTSTLRNHVYEKSGPATSPASARRRSVSTHRVWPHSTFRIQVRAARSVDSAVILITPPSMRKWTSDVSVDEATPTERQKISDYNSVASQNGHSQVTITRLSGYNARRKDTQNRKTSR